MWNSVGTFLHLCNFKVVLRVKCKSTQKKYKKPDQKKQDKDNRSNKRRTTVRNAGPTWNQHFINTHSQLVSLSQADVNGIIQTFSESRVSASTCEAVAQFWPEYIMNP